MNISAVKKLYKELSLILSLQRITFTFIELDFGRTLGDMQTVWETRKREITEAGSFFSADISVENRKRRYGFYTTFSASRIQ